MRGARAALEPAGSACAALSTCSSDSAVAARLDIGRNRTEYHLVSRRAAGHPDQCIAAAGACAALISDPNSFATDEPAALRLN